MFVSLLLCAVFLTVPAYAVGTRIDDYEGVHIDKCQCVVWAQKFANAKYGSVIPLLGGDGGARLIWEDPTKHPSNAVQITNAPGLLPNKDDIVVFSGAVDPSTGGYGHVGIVYQVNSRSDVVLVDTNWNGDELGYIHSVNLNWSSVYGWFHENNNPNGGSNSIPRYPGSNPSASDIRSMLVAAGQKYKIPPHILFGIAFQESGWREYGSDGQTLVSGDGGIGIMQLTGATAAAFDVNRLASDIAYNIDSGAKVLSGKWDITPVIGDNDRAKLENWYYAIWAYNGFIANSAYPGKILDWIANCPNGQWQNAVVTPPTPSQIASMGTIPNTPTPIHVDANYDGIIDGDGGGGDPHPTPYLTVSESDTATTEGQAGFFRHGTPRYWNDATDSGDGGHMLWTYTGGPTWTISAIGGRTCRIRATMKYSFTFRDFMLRRTWRITKSMALTARRTKPLTNMPIRMFGSV